MLARQARRAIVVVAVLALTAGCASRPAAGHRLALSSVAGTAWRLISISSGRRTISLPEPTRPRLDFGRDASIFLDDTVNALSGRYLVDGDGITISHAGSTAVGYAGTDPARTTTIAAIDSIVYRFSNGTSLLTNHVSASRAGDVLYIVSQQYKLKYLAAGPYTTPASGSPSATTS